MINIGILGAARIAPAAVIQPAARREDCQVLAVASRRAGKAEPYAGTHGIPKVHDSYEALLADPDIDLVYNALPPVEHARWSIAALEAGKHVLCEKPFAMNGREAQVMVETAERTGKRLIEAFHDRYHPVFLHLLELRDSGALGAVTEIEAEFSVAIPYSEGEIRHIPEMGGGALMDLGCYPLHWVRNLMGSEPEVRKAEGERTRRGVDLRIETELEFADGAVATVRTSMDVAMPFTARLLVRCEKGVVEIDNPVSPHKGHSVRERLGGRPFREHTLSGGTTYDFQLAAVLEALQSGTALPTEGADSVGNMVLIDKVYEKAGF